MGEILFTQKQRRANSIGMTAIGSLEEAFRRNYEIGVTDGIMGLPQIIKSHLEEVKAEYSSLLIKERDDAPEHADSHPQ